MYMGLEPTPVAACLFGLRVRILPGAWMSVVCCQVEFYALVQRSHTECDVSECDHEASTVRRPWSTKAVAP